jgi:hypothetical protein
VTPRGGYKHPYSATGAAVDMLATLDDVVERFGHNPALAWAPHCKVLDLFYADREVHREVIVYSTDDPQHYRVTVIDR